MRHRTILFWVLMLVLLAGTSLYAQCPATAMPGQFISFQLSATVQGQPAPDNPNFFWQVSPSGFSANPASGNHVTTISGTIPASASGSFGIQAEYFAPSTPTPILLYSFSCSIQIVTNQPLQ